MTQSTFGTFLTEGKWVKSGWLDRPRSTPTLYFAEEVREVSQAPGWPAQPLVSTATARLTADTVAGCGGAGPSVCVRPDGTRWFSPGGHREQDEALDLLSRGTMKRGPLIRGCYLAG